MSAVAPRASRLIWLQGLACGALVTFATPTAILLCGLMAPAGLAAALDGAPGRPMARVVALACAAMTAGPVWRLWVAGQGNDAALAALADPMVLGSAWAAGACGWAMTELLPLLVRAWMEITDAARLAALRAEQQRLEQEWDFS